MSIDTCASCAASVDTDFDVDCYVERKGRTGEWDRMVDEDMAAAPRMEG